MNSHSLYHWWCSVRLITCIFLWIWWLWTSVALTCRCCDLGRRITCWGWWNVYLYRFTIWSRIVWTFSIWTCRTLAIWVSHLVVGALNDYRCCDYCHGSIATRLECIWPLSLRTVSTLIIRWDVLIRWTSWLCILDTCCSVSVWLCTGVACLTSVPLCCDFIRPTDSWGCRSQCTHACIVVTGWFTISSRAIWSLTRMASEAWSIKLLNLCG